MVLLVMNWTCTRLESLTIRTVRTAFSDLPQRRHLLEYVLHLRLSGEPDDDLSRLGELRGASALIVVEDVLDGVTSGDVLQLEVVAEHVHVGGFAAELQVLPIGSYPSSDVVVAFQNALSELLEVAQVFRTPIQRVALAGAVLFVSAFQVAVVDRRRVEGENGTRY
jgi:hypothetical protein